MRENLDPKEKVINQWLGSSPTKSHQLSSYRDETQDGYDSDYIANTNNLKGKFVFIVDTTKYDANTSVNNNGEIEGTPHSSRK